MSTRAQRRREAEDVALRGLSGEGERPWVRAQQLAQETQRPWRSTARALSRLVARGMVRLRVVCWRDRRYRPRETKLYQLVEQQIDLGSWPVWAMPRVLMLPPTDKPARSYDRRVTG